MEGLTPLNAEKTRMVYSPRLIIIIVVVVVVFVFVFLVVVVVVKSVQNTLTELSRQNLRFL